MTTRTSIKDVAFRRPFILDGMDAVQPAGAYTVETKEEKIDTMLPSTWRQVRTVMCIRTAGAAKYILVKPEQLHEALMRDAAQQNPSSPNAPKARRDRARAMRHVTVAAR